MRGLSELGYEVSVGVLHEGDTDAIVAERLEQVPIDKRDFTGGQAAALWRALRDRATVFDSVEAVLHAAQEILRDLTVAKR